MRSRAIALLLPALALSASACASIWGFQTVSSSEDAGVVVTDDAGTDQPDASVVNPMGTDAGCSTFCGSRCADTDPNNCGSCGNRCDSLACSKGVCLCPMCKGSTQCVDIRNSRTNCGGCGATCPPGGYCRPLDGGSPPLASCVCPSGQMQCGAECIDVTKDSSNCGACSNACPSGSYCVNSNCQCLGTGTSVCNSHCVSNYNDLNFCGDCNTVCRPGVGCSPMGCTCTGATIMCPINLILTCINANADPNNCGRCGNVCWPGADCTNGVCGCTQVGSDMVVHCAATASTPTDVCADLTVDSNNCGVCGNKCGGGTHCEGGKCVCGSLLGACPGGACVDLMNNRDNCGSCGRACTGVTSCVNGVCK